MGGQGKRVRQLMPEAVAEEMSVADVERMQVLMKLDANAGVSGGESGS